MIICQLLMSDYIHVGDMDDIEVDPLDAYMKHVGDHMDSTKRSEIKHHLHDLRKVLPSITHTHVSLCVWLYRKKKELES